MGQGSPRPARDGPEGLVRLSQQGPAESTKWQSINMRIFIIHRMGQRPC